LEAEEGAQRVGRSIWEFAVEIERLHMAGLTNSNLRVLLCEGIVQHGVEKTVTQHKGRSFGPGRNLRFTTRTCFVLTPSGIQLARQVLAGAPPNRQELVQPASPLPHWDHARRELRVGDTIVKQFKVPAPNQEIILASFQEDGWPAHIDDPLVPDPELDPKKRLHDVINRLNRNQRQRLIVFHGVGNGKGIRWELAKPGPIAGRVTAGGSARPRNGLHCRPDPG
jgi:hypothetical protein